ncbi:MAG: DUF1189 domain-containing protein [Clostridium sp.]
MEKTNFFKKLYNNLFNIKTFPKYMREGLGRAILYAFILSLILGATQGIGLTLDLRKSFNTTIESLKQKEYKFELKDGILDIQNSPIKIEENGILLYADTNKSINDKEELRSISVHSDISVLILKDGIIYSTQESDQYVLYKDLYLTNLTNDELISQIELMAKIFPPIFFTISIIIGFFDYLLNCLIIAAFSMLSNLIMGLRIRFSGVYALSLYAGTLPSILVTIIGLFMPNVYLTQAMMIGTLLYVILIFRNIRNEILENNKLN